MISPEDKLRYQTMNQEDINKAFKYACYNSDLDLVQYLLCSSELKHNADIHHKEEIAFIWACQVGALEIIKYLLTSPELKEHSLINSNESAGFLHACQNGDLNMIKYLLTSPNLKIHADLYAQKSYSLKLVCAHDKIEVINYFINEKNMVISKAIKNWLEENPHKSSNYALTLIKEREIKLLNDKLNDKLEPKQINFKIVKI